MLFTAAGIVGLALQQTTGVHASRSGTIVLMLYVLAYPLSQMRRASNASKLEKPGPQHRSASFNKPLQRDWHSYRALHHHHDPLYYPWRTGRRDARDKVIVRYDDRIVCLLD